MFRSTYFLQTACTQINSTNIPQADEGEFLLELGQRKHTKFYIACRLYWNSTVKEKKYRSWALKSVYTIGINSTKISNMLFNWQEVLKNIYFPFF